MSIVSMMIVMFALGYMVFVFVAESFNPLKVPSAKRGVPGYGVRYIRYRWGIRIAALFVISPIFTLAFRSGDSGTSIVYNIKFVVGVLFLIVCYYGVKTVMRYLQSRRGLVSTDEDIVESEWIATDVHTKATLRRRAERDQCSVEIDADSTLVPSSTGKQRQGVKRIRRGVFRHPLKTRKTGLAAVEK